MARRPAGALRPGAGPDPVDIHVGKRIRERRSNIGMSQDRVADGIGVSFQQVQKYENGANRVGASRLWQLARILDVGVMFFYGDDDPAVASGFAEPPPEGFDSDPLRRRETRELVNAYFDIADPALRRRFFEMAKTLAPPRAETGRRRGRRKKDG